MNQAAPKPHSLPVPEPDALEHSRRLTAHLADAIRDAGGWLPFDRFMELALYAPGLGYYAAGAAKFGRLAADGSDFVTAPELTPFFARTLARQVSEIFEQTGDAKVLEFGAGSGRLAADLLLALEAEGAPCERYSIMELSGELRARQRDTIARVAPHLLDRVSWLDQLPDAFHGVMLGNEVLDAMPVRLWARRAPANGQDGRPVWFERGVVCTPDGFAWEERRYDGALPEALAPLAALPPAQEYLTETHEAAAAFVRSVAPLLARGVLLLVDYGFPAREYYHPQRAQGTLMCHYRHHAHDDPFYYPGLQDITAHVEFSGIADAGVQAGLDLLGFTSQARFLMNAGIVELMSALDPSDPKTYLPAAAAAQKLLSEAEMGELFKVIAFGRGMDEWAGLIGFATGERSHAL
ncbi:MULTISPECIES: SAM-dependent methyltransferase [Pandoraea]|uniref:SAM-dependent methyltransferase n=1 Tax=Pandoraea nosoerga TaxID=2508296 RepID=A0A5E4S3S7_9BURK|nr:MULTISPECIES: SAM-dependent methyltransferase [Pandoraea]MBN4667674.1 SAM-dependent methyltransferase [Pandoraea nosoerga]VVD69234.1 SAM-dependent methyltransferase [Pandoraea nosoerga]